MVVIPSTLKITTLNIVERKIMEANNVIERDESFVLSVAFPNLTETNEYLRWLKEFREKSDKVVLEVGG